MEEEIQVLQPLGGIETYMATDFETVLRNIEFSMQRNLTDVEFLPEFGKPKGDEPIAIAGGGPSIKYTIDELRNFKQIIACGSAHDWLVENKIKPTYCLVLDPDPISANYLKKPQVTCNYLIASCCDPLVFDTLANFPVTRWHSAGPDMDWFTQLWEKFKVEGEKKPVIGGGCTCGLRSISMAMLFGYRNLHFFGLDSNLEQNTFAHHAYEFVDPVNEQLGDVIEMRLGGPNGRYFKVAKYMMAQLWGFKELIDKFGAHFDVTIHGDSIIYEFMRIKRENIRRKALEKKNGSENHSSLSINNRYDTGVPNGPISKAN